MSNTPTPDSGAFSLVMPQNSGGSTAAEAAINGINGNEATNH